MKNRNRIIGVTSGSEDTVNIRRSFAAMFGTMLDKLVGPTKKNPDLSSGHQSETLVYMAQPHFSHSNHCSFVVGRAPRSIMNPSRFRRSVSDHQREMHRPQRTSVQ